MEIFYFTLIGAALYLSSDWILDRIETKRGSRFANRSVIFFVIILSLSMVVFAGMRALTESPMVN
ncbi:MAG: hypothetical protein HQL94_09955 [Magnetococcales bacterium]|nr:hypothetical protein [Magnetococcales bacterium]MBF0438720.1 hypothetical protein [Magnetococcales bacterium]